MKIRANIIDIFNETISAGYITITNGRISDIISDDKDTRTSSSELEMNSSFPDPSLPFILPGFIDAHVHIESSMLIPSEFARLAVVHGTVGTVSDPHEIANVCGMKGIDYMIENGKSVNFKFNFGAPSCVPATIFETAGDKIDSADVEQLINSPDIKYLSEMMNFPGVITQDEEVMKKISVTHKAGKPVDGHAPGLMGDALRKYHAAGISTDHECFTAEEAMEKLQLGMKILIREGSAAKNFEALIGLLNDHWNEMMFCSDDKHPDSLVHGHINELCRRAVAKNINIFKVLKAACVNPVQHYKLDIGLLRIGDPADFIILQDLKDFEVIQTYINGVCVAENGHTLIHNTLYTTDGKSGSFSGRSGSSLHPPLINKFNCDPINLSDIFCAPIELLRGGKLPVIEALDGQLITNKLMAAPKIAGGNLISDIDNDILKIVVVNRYNKAPVAKSFIKNVGLKRGAIASSVGHDSHNIIAVGADDRSICNSINKIIENKGGISCDDGNKTNILALPVAGLMSVEDGYKVAASYTKIDALAKSLGSLLSAPFMTLSFMALLVIPSLKLSDRGLFDGEKFEFI